MALPETIPGDAKSIAVIGDLQMTAGFVRFVKRRENNEAAQADLMADLVERVDTIAALVVVGDLVYTARSRSDWRHFDRLVEPIAVRVPVLPAIGNHDYNCFFVQLCRQARIPAKFARRFPWMEPGRPYFTAYGDIALLMLDSETSLARQAEWLARSLREVAEQYAVALVFFHRPPYTNTAVRGAVGGDTDVQQWIVPVLETSPMPVITISGHVHGFEHLLVDGIHYIISAGGGGPRGPLLPQRPSDVYGGRDCATDPDGSVIRPFNYLLIKRLSNSLEIVVRGFCGAGADVEELERFQLPLG